MYMFQKCKTKLASPSNPMPTTSRYHMSLQPWSNRCCRRFDIQCQVVDESLVHADTEVLSVLLLLLDSDFVAVECDSAP